MSFLLRRTPLARADWRDFDAAHSRPDQNPIQRPWVRVNTNRPVWRESNMLMIADYSATLFQLGGVSHEQMCYTPHWGFQFDLNIDGNVIQAQYWGACISPSWTKTGFDDILNQPIVGIARDAFNLSTRIVIMVFTSLSSIEYPVMTGNMGGLMERTWYTLRVLVDFDRLVRVYRNGVMMLQYWLPTGLAAGPDRRAANFLNQTASTSWQKNLRLFDQIPEFRTKGRWTVDSADDFNRGDGAVGNGWTQLGANAGIVSNSWSTTGTADGSRMLLKASAVSTGVQRVEAIIGGNIAPNNSVEASLVLRSNATGTDAVVANIYANAIYISRMSAGPGNPTMNDYTSTDEVTVGAGDIVAFSATADAAWVEVNGVTVLAAGTNGLIPIVGRQYRGLRVTRRSFTNGGSWNAVQLLEAA